MQSLSGVVAAYSRRCFVRHTGTDAQLHVTSLSDHALSVVQFLFMSLSFYVRLLRHCHAVGRVDLSVAKKSQMDYFMGYIEILAESRFFAI